MCIKDGTDDDFIPKVDCFSASDDSESTEDVDDSEQCISEYEDGLL